MTRLGKTSTIAGTANLLLFFLLTGVMPYDQQQIHYFNLAEAQEAIEEEEEVINIKERQNTRISIAVFVAAPHKNKLKKGKVGVVSFMQVYAYACVNRLDAAAVYTSNWCLYHLLNWCLYHLLNSSLYPQLPLCQ